MRQTSLIIIIDSCLQVEPDTTELVILYFWRTLHDIVVIIWFIFSQKQLPVFFASLRVAFVYDFSAKYRYNVKADSRDKK